MNKGIDKRLTELIKILNKEEIEYAEGLISLRKDVIAYKRKGV